MWLTLTAGMLQVFGFSVETPELAQLSFRCFNECPRTAETDLIAEASFVVSEVRQGFRTVQLFDIHGKKDANYAFATLFVFVKLGDALPPAVAVDDAALQSTDVTLPVRKAIASARSV